MENRARIEKKIKGVVLGHLGAAKPYMCLAVLRKLTKGISSLPAC
jgi:hypothetical protein